MANGDNELWIKPGEDATTKKVPKMKLKRFLILQASFSIYSASSALLFFALKINITPKVREKNFTQKN